MSKAGTETTEFQWEAESFLQELKGIEICTFCDWQDIWNLKIGQARLYVDTLEIGTFGLAGKESSTFCLLNFQIQASSHILQFKPATPVPDLGLGNAPCRCGFGYVPPQPLDQISMGSSTTEQVSMLISWCTDFPKGLASESMLHCYKMALALLSGPSTRFSAQVNTFRNLGTAHHSSAVFFLNKDGCSKPKLCSSFTGLPP